MTCEYPIGLSLYLLLEVIEWSIEIRFHPEALFLVAANLAGPGSSHGFFDLSNGRTVGSDGHLFAGEKLFA